MASKDLEKVKIAGERESDSTIIIVFFFVERDERVICVFQHNDTETVNLNINFFIQ